MNENVFILFQKLNSDELSNNEKIISGQNLLSLQEENLSKDVKTIYLGVDRHVIPFHDEDNDYRYLSDATAKKNFYPAAVCKYIFTVKKILLFLC